MKISAQMIVTALGAATLLLAGASGASATTRWQHHHPWRAEVNHRLARQNHRITLARREGELSGAQAHRLRTEVRGVRAQERFDASHHGGRLTRAEHRRLNREENAVSRQIGR